MSKKRMKPEARRDQIVGVAVSLAENTHYLKVSRDQIAKQLGVTPQSIIYHFSTMCKLQRAIIRAAICGENLRVLAQGLAANCPHAKKAPEELRQQAARSIV